MLVYIRLATGVIITTHSLQTLYYLYHHVVHHVVTLVYP